jgi:hypothetical protein
MLPSKKAAITKGMLITSAVESRISGIVAVAHGLQEVLARIVDSDYGIVSIVFSRFRRRLRSLRTGRILPTGIGSNVD